MKKIIDPGMPKGKLSVKVYRKALDPPLTSLSSLLQSYWWGRELVPGEPNCISFSAALNRFHFSAQWVFPSLVLLHLRESFSTQVWVTRKASRAHIDQCGTKLIDTHSTFYLLGWQSENSYRWIPREFKHNHPQWYPKDENASLCCLSLSSILISWVLHFCIFG